MTKRIAIITYAITALFNLSLIASEKQTPTETAVVHVPRHVNDTPIDAQTILGLSPKAPEDVVQNVTAWLTSNPKVVDTALGYEPLIGGMRPFHDATNAALKKAGCDNMSRCNYVFVTANGHIIKIAGHVNRRDNLTMLAADFGRQYRWGRPLEKADFDALETNLKDDEFDARDEQGKQVAVRSAPRTYQTVSRMAHHLLLQQAVKQRNWRNVTAPNTYLVHVPGRPTYVSDRNYVIVEKQLNDLKDVGILSEHEKTTVKEVISSTGLSGCPRRDLLRAPDGSLVFLDGEQPNNANPKDFCHKNPRAFAHNVSEGLKEFEDNFKE